MNARQAKKNVKNAAPAVEKAVAETVKKEVKAEAPKKEAVKAEAPKKEVVKAEAPKKEVVKAEAPKKEAVKTEAPKAETKRGRKPKTEAEKAATAAKKATTKTSSTQVVIQCLGNEATIDSIVEKITNIFVSEGHRASSIKDLRVYLKPEEGLAYYVINEKNAGSVSLF